MSNQAAEPEQGKKTSRVVRQQWVDEVLVENIEVTAAVEPTTGELSVSMNGRSVIKRDRDEAIKFLHELVDDLAHPVHRDDKGAVRPLTTAPATEQ